MKFEIHTTHTAPYSSRSALTDVEKTYRFIPNLFGVLAESPLAISAYLQLSSLIREKSSLSPVEQQVVMLAASVENGCDYCVAAHSAVAAMAQTPPSIIESLRSGQDPEDRKTAVLAKFTRAIVHHRGWVPDETLYAFLEAGYHKAQILDVLTIVSLKTLSNYTNHLAHTPLDDAFAAERWTPPKTY